MDFSSLNFPQWGYWGPLGQLLGLPLGAGGLLLIWWHGSRGAQGSGGSGKLLGPALAVVLFQGSFAYGFPAVLVATTNVHRCPFGLQPSGRFLLSFQPCALFILYMFHFESVNAQFRPGLGFC